MRTWLTAVVAGGRVAELDGVGQGLASGHELLGSVTIGTDDLGQALAAGRRCKNEESSRPRRIHVGRDSADSKVAAITFV